MIEALKRINEYLIKAHENNPKELEKYVLIKKMLDEKDLFLNIDIEYAYSILRDLQIPENDLKTIYLALINK